MKDIFVIGCEDPSFRYSAQITSLPQFRGIVMPAPNTPFNRFTGGAYRQEITKLKTLSLGSFFNYARKNPGTTLVSFYDFPGGRIFLDRLKKIDRYKIEISDFYNFYLQNNIPVLFVPASEERTQILNARPQWAELRKRLTDDFSKFSLDCYLSAAETQDLSKMYPAYIEAEFLLFNRYSRKLGLVPSSSEIYVDVGAWDGDTIAGFIDIAGGYKEIHAFEPLKTAFAKLKERGSYLHNFHAYPHAASNFNGEADFIANGVGSHIINNNGAMSVATERISCVKLDDVLEEITFLKVEVEGHEPKVLEGASRIIEKYKPEIVARSYHYPLDPIRIIEAVDKIHKYKYVALRFYSVDLHSSSVLFSDRAPFA